MAEITTTGIIPTTLAEYITLLEDIFKSVFGDDFNVDPETPQGQLIGDIALSMSQSDDAHVITANALDIFRAADSQLEGLFSLLAIYKRDESHTTVTATLAGVPATLIQSGSRAKSDNGDLYALNDDTTLSGGGTADATMTAIESGPLEVGIGELTQVVDVVPGWETVTNAAAGSLGLDAETNTEYRKKYFDQLFKNAISVLDAITAEVREVESVVEVFGAENDTDTLLAIDGVNVNAHSIAIVVDGGAEAEIAAAIRLKKTGGTGTVGTTSVSDPPHTDINFFFVDKIEIEVDVDITIDSNFPGNGTVLLKERIYNYIAGTFAGAINDDYFESDGMTISEDLHKQRLYTPINSVPGHVVNTLTMNIKLAGNVDTIPANLDQKVTITSLDDIGISVT